MIAPVFEISSADPLGLKAGHRHLPLPRVLAANDYAQLLPDAWAKGRGVKVQVASQTLCRSNSIEPRVKRRA